MVELNTPPLKRELIFDAAYSLFVENGYKETKMSDIASKAEIGKGTIYDYFPSKSELFLQLLDQRLCKEYSYLPDISNLPISAFEKLVRFGEFDLKIIKKWSDVLSHSVLKNLENSENENMFKMLFSLISLRFSSMKEIIEEGIASKEFKEIDADLFAIGFLGALQSYATAKYHSFECVSLLSGSDLSPFSIKSENWDDIGYLEMLISGIKK